MTSTFAPEINPVLVNYEECSILESIEQAARAGRSTAKNPYKDYREAKVEILCPLIDLQPVPQNQPVE